MKEIESLVLPSDTEQHVDNEAHALYAEVNPPSVATYEALKLPQARLKEHERDFLASGCKNDVNLQAPFDGNEDLVDHIESLKAAKTELLARDLATDIKNAYCWKINEEIAQLHMRHESVRGNMYGFRKWNEFIYGELDQDLYAAGVDMLASQAVELLNSPHANVQRYAEKVLCELEGDRGYRELITPDDTLFSEMRSNYLDGFFRFLFADVDVPQEGKVNHENGNKILRHVLEENLTSDYQLKDAEGATWSVSHYEKALKRPATYNMPWRRFWGLPGHELTHLIEHINGGRSPLILSQDGLDRYENGNEGRAIIPEQVIYDSFAEFARTVRWRDIVRRYVAIGYAVGGQENNTHTFSETYAFINCVDRMYQAKKMPEATDEEIAAQAHSRTWNLLTRVLKGTDGKGGAYFKDTVYLKGNVATWLVAELQGVQEVANGNLGKFDIANPRHIALLQKYRVLPGGFKENAG